MIHKEVWYKEVQGTLFEKSYRKALRHYLQGEDLRELQMYVERLGLHKRAWTDLGKVLKKDPSEEGLKYLWFLSEEVEELSPALYPEVGVPVLSEHTAGGLDIDITLPGLGEGEITLYRGGQWDEWGTWGEDIYHWMSGNLVGLLDSLEGTWWEGFQGEVVSLIVNAGVEAIKKTLFWDQEDVLVQEVE